MAGYVYTPGIFVDGTEPAIDAEHLNAGEQAIVRSSFRAGGTFTGEVTIDAIFSKCVPAFSAWTYFGGASDTGDYDIKDGTKGFIVPDGFVIAQVFLSVNYGSYTGDRCLIELAHLRGATETIVAANGSENQWTNANPNCSALLPCETGDKIYPYVYGKAAKSVSVKMEIILL